MPEKITLQESHLKQMGFTTDMISKWYIPLKTAAEKYQINTGLRLSGWFSNLLHESGGFKVFTENLNYSSTRLVQVFPKYFPTVASTSGYAGNPEKIANKIYGGRMGNGIESTGDGYRFRGRGIIQLTGRSNYKDASVGIGVDVLNHPDNLLDPTNSAMTAGWFYTSRGCNTFADGDSISHIRKKINGGTIGLSDVTKLYENCKIIFGVKPGDVDPNVFSRGSTPGAKKGSFNEASGSGTTSLSGANPKYPWNWVWESRSHHIFEVDDTPGSERIQMMHRTGSYSEINPLGTRIDKSVQDWYTFIKGDKYLSVNGDSTVKVDGQGYNRYTGDYVLNTDGSAYFESPSRIQFNTPVLAARELIITPDLNIDTATVNDIIMGWIWNAKFSETARSLGGVPLTFETVDISSDESVSKPAIEVSEDNSVVTFNSPAIVNHPIQFQTGANVEAPEENHAIAVLVDEDSPSGFSLCYSVNGVWFRSSTNMPLAP